MTNVILFRPRRRPPPSPLKLESEMLASIFRGVRFRDPVALIGALGGELADILLRSDPDNGAKALRWARSCGYSLINLVEQKIADGERSAGPMEFLLIDAGVPDRDGWPARDVTRDASVTKRKEG